MESRLQFIANVNFMNALLYWYETAESIAERMIATCAKALVQPALEKSSRQEGQSATDAGGDL